MVKTREETNTAVARAISYAIVETSDKVGRPLRKLAFYDAGGERVESWNVPLDLFVEAWRDFDRSFALLAERLHRTLIARRIVHDLPVAKERLDEHDTKLLAETVVTEKRLHGELPNPLCYLCVGAGGVAETDGR